MGETEGTNGFKGRTEERLDNLEEEHAHMRKRIHGIANHVHGLELRFVEANASARGLATGLGMSWKTMMTIAGGLMALGGLIVKILDLLLRH